MANVTLSLEEYHALMRLVESERESEGAHEEAVEAKKTRTRSRTKNDRIMSRALSEANSKAKLKNGSWRKGWNQKKLMIEAHRLRRKYSK